MTKLITIIGTFQDVQALIAQAPSSIQFQYEDGNSLTPKDAAKVDLITGYYLANDIYPVFVPVKPITSDGGAIIAEATIDLGKWSNEGLPTFKLLAMDGKPQNLPVSKRGKGSKSLGRVLPLVDPSLVKQWIAEAL